MAENTLQQYSSEEESDNENIPVARGRTKKKDTHWNFVKWCESKEEAISMLNDEDIWSFFTRIVQVTALNITIDARK